MAIWKFIKPLLSLLKKTNPSEGARGDFVRNGKQQKDFIEDDRTADKPKVRTLPVTPPSGAQQTPVAVSKDFVIRPLNQAASSTWVFPPLNLLADVKQADADRGDVNKNAGIIEKTLDSY